MAQRATSLGPKPSLFSFVFFDFFFAFLSLLLIEKPCFPPKKGHFCVFFCVSLCFSLAFFGLPLFHFLFLCLSLVLFFLPSFLFLISVSGSAFSFCFVCFFVSRCSFSFCFSAVVLFCFES